jgi:hypothetical protein
MGFGALALSSLLPPTLLGGDAPTGRLPHFAPKAKSVIFLFMVGGVSHLESFDYKPALEQYGGKSVLDTPFKDVPDNPIGNAGLERGLGRAKLKQLYPLQTGFKQYGKNGTWVSDWFPHIGGVVDDLAIVRSLWTTDNNHQAQYQFLTGRNIAEGNFPSLGSWVHYGLGSLNQNLPQYIVFGDVLGSCCGGPQGHGADYLGPAHAGIQLDTAGGDALPFANPEAAITRAEQQRSFELMRSLNEETRTRFPDDPSTEARIKSYELAFRMQMAVPEVMDLSRESAETRKLYGIDRLGDGFEGRFAKQCLLARRFVEGGTRFIQIHHGAGGAGAWDSHSELKKNHSKLANQVDQPIAGLIKDLKQRGLFDSTLIVFATEFGRTPGLETAEIQAGTREGRDHHPFGFSVFLAGGGIKGGVVHGATDELGWHAVQDRHYVTDVHATIMHQLGLVPSRLDLPGRKRIDKDYGEPIRAIMT